MPQGQIPQIPSKAIFNQLVDDWDALGISQVMASSLDLIFSALSDPTRRQILTLLLEDDMAVTDVAEPFEMSLAAISKHLSVLSNAGLIQQERRGRVKWCKLEPDAMRAASIWLQGFGQFDAVDLDQFEQFLKSELPASDF
jgi:DNA-binding transcriptional ArsR family regulator